MDVGGLRGVEQVGQQAVALANDRVVGAFEPVAAVADGEVEIQPIGRNVGHDLRPCGGPGGDAGAHDDLSVGVDVGVEGRPEVKSVDRALGVWVEHDGVDGGIGGRERQGGEKEHGQSPIAQSAAT